MCLCPLCRDNGEIALRILASLILASSFLTSTVQAKDDQVKRGPVPGWVVPSEPLAVPADASGLLFVRSQDTLVHLDAKGQLHYNAYRIKIIHPNALQLGNLSFTWKPESGAPTVHAIKVHRDGETIDALEKASFEILRREDQLEAAILDGNLTAVVRVPDLRVGDELEVAFTARYSDDTLRDDVSGVLFLQPNPSPGRFRLGLSWIEGQQPNIKMTDDMASAVQKSDRKIEFKFENPVTLTPAKDAPPRFNWQRVIEYSDFSDWASISRQFSALYESASKIPESSPLKREISRIAAAHASPLDRASAALKMVQQDVRYIYVGLGSGNLTPSTAEETWQRRYGDCKGKTALLLALLAGLGIEAEPLLANNSGGDDGLDQRLPSPQMFDHVLVRARIDGKDYFMDGTMPPVVPPGAEPVIPYRWILPLRAEGTKLERLAWRPARRPDQVTLFEVDAREGFDTPARITNTTIIRGIDGLQQQVQLSAVAPADLLSGLRQEMVGDTWQSVDDVQWRYDQKAQASILKISGTGMVDWDNDSDGTKSYTLPGGGFSPPPRRIRAAGQDQNLPFYTKPEYSCYVTTVRVPTVTKPVHWSYNSEFDTEIFGRQYYRAFDFRDGALRMVRGSRIEQQEIEAVSAQRDNTRIASFDNSMALLSYDPTGQDDPANEEKTVPATYDIDWSADSVPCLAENGDD